MKKIFLTISLLVSATVNANTLFVKYEGKSTDFRDAVHVLGPLLQDKSFIQTKAILSKKLMGTSTCDRYVVYDGIRELYPLNQESARYLDIKLSEYEKICR